jgi:spoIIIJ-associated protein
MPSEKVSIEVSGKTVEEAIEQGLSALNLARQQVEIEVVNEGRSGVLGIGGEDALVRIVALPEAKPQVEPKESVTTEAPPTETGEEPLAPESELAQLANDILRELLDRMGIRAQITTRIAQDLSEEGEDPPLTLNIVGDDLGILIGRRGETLRALQYLTRLMLSRKLERWEPVVVDVESYRVRRRRLLRQLANRMAERVAFSKQRVVLEAMPAHERRIVHIALRDHPDVTTKSVGEGENRKVTINPR